MKLTSKNPNYAATIVRIKNLIPLDGCDNVLAFPIFGYQSIVSKDTELNSLAVLFTAESQLSPDYCQSNNLYRKPESNKDQTQKGYLEDKRRIKALKFRGHNSSALTMPLSSLSYLKIDVSKLKEGDQFDTIDGVEICTKYIIQRNEPRDPKNKVRGKNKIFKRVESKLFPEHLDSDNYFRNAHKYKDNDIVVVTQKLHGSSGRFGNILVKRKLSFIERIAKKIGIKVNETEYDYIAGSRRVIKDEKIDKVNNHYYKSDIWNVELEKVKGLIPKNYILYGEIIGWVGESQIQKNYTYQIPRGQSELYIYRISVINEDGYSVDLSWNAVKEFCKITGIKYCPEMWIGVHIEFEVDYYLNKKFREFILTENTCLPLDPESPCDEGVIVRLEGIQPYLTKAKSPIFLEHETKQLDKGVVDIESEESIIEEK